MNKHTPGPWETDFAFGTVVIAGPRGDAQRVADCRHSDLDDVAAFGKSQANASLVSAAPDLLGVVQRLKSLLVATDQDAPEIEKPLSAADLVDELTAMQEQIDAAVAKATGADEE